MKIFGTIYPFIETGDESFMLGRHVANFEFLKALIEYSSFDEIHLFCLNVGHFEMTAAKLKTAGLPTNRLARIKLFLYSHLVNQISATRYHVFHCGGWGYFLAGLAYLRQKHALNRFPITGCIHSLNSMETPYHALKVLCAPLSAGDAIICTSEAGREALIKTFKKIGCCRLAQGCRLDFAGSTEIIPLGVSDEAFNVLPRNEARIKLNINQAAFCALSIARFSPRTKMDYYPLMHTLGRLVKRNPDKEIAVLLAGSGGDTAIRLVHDAIAEKGLGQCCRVITNFDTSLKSALYGAADAFVALSDNLQETFGISVIEAMAAGLPAVVSDIDGYKEHIDDGIEGFRIATTWIDVLDIAELADIMNFDTMQLFLAQCMAVDTGAAEAALQRLMENKELRQSMGEKARSRARERYRWRNIIQRYESLWERLREAVPERTGDDTVPANPFMHDYLDIFSHYPTRNITDSDILAITDYGEKTLACRTIPPAYADIASVLNTTDVISILESLAREEMSLGFLKEAMRRNADNNNLLVFIVLWMAKYGLIKIMR